MDCCYWLLVTKQYSLHRVTPVVVSKFYPTHVPPHSRTSGKNVKCCQQQASSSFAGSNHTNQITNVQAFQNVGTVRTSAWQSKVFAYVFPTSFLGDLEIQTFAFNMFLSFSHSPLAHIPYLLEAASGKNKLVKFEQVESFATKDGFSLEGCPRHCVTTFATFSHCDPTINVPFLFVEFPEILNERFVLRRALYSVLVLWHWDKAAGELLLMRRLLVNKRLITSQVRKFSLYGLSPLKPNSKGKRKICWSHQFVHLHHCCNGWCV